MERKSEVGETLIESAGKQQDPGDIKHTSFDGGKKNKCIF